MNTLHLQRDHYKVFFDTSREGMYITTKDGYFIDANQAFCQLLGYTRIEILRNPVEETLALPGERRRFRSEIEANGSVTGFRVSLLSKTGEELPCLLSAVVLRDFEGEVDGYIGLVRPLRSLPGVMSQAEVEARNFSLALRGSQDGLWEWNLRQNEVLYSSRWKALLGYASYELSKSVSEWFDRVHVEDITQVKQAIQTYTKGEGGALSAYFRMKNKSGDYLWMLVRGVGEFDETGKCVRLAGSLSNITAHIKMVENLKQQEEALEHVNETLSHDKALLARYFSGDVLARILQEGTPGKTSSSRETVGAAAILQVKVNRIQGLWRVTGAEACAQFLNELLTDLMDLAYGRGGSVNKILGDTLIISFGCPLAQDDDLERAMATAREILDYRRTYNDVRPGFLKEELEFSLGLAWGEVFSGTLGSIHRLEYTLLGTPVTRAAALQRSAQKLGLPLLVDESVRKVLGTSDRFAPADASVPEAWVPL